MSLDCKECGSIGIAMPKLKLCTQCWIERAGPEVTTLTFSQLSMFLSCRRKAFWRYQEQLAPKIDAEALFLGKLVHGLLETHFTGIPQKESRLRPSDEVAAIARAMVTGYKARWGDRPLVPGDVHQPDNDFDVLTIEDEFAVPILNPATGAASRSFILRGKIDGLVRLRATDELMILEHKTASKIDGQYLEKLWMDFQTLIYVAAYRQMGVDVKGCVYDILAKPGIKRREGETEEEFDIRAMTLAAKNKSGKTTAKRQLPETIEEYSARLADACASPEAYHREILYFEPRRFEELAVELWELQREYAHARSTKVWPRNPQACYSYGSRCPYWALCASGDDPLMRSQFDHRPAHEELGQAKKEEAIF